MLYALLNSEDSILRYQDFDEMPLALAPEKELRWLPVQDTKSAPAAGYQLQGPSVSITQTAVTRVWSAVPAVPHEVTNFQARAALIRAGKFDTINSAILALGGEAAQAWEYANVVERNGALVNMLGSELGLSPETLDDLFRVAATITA